MNVQDLIRAHEGEEQFVYDDANGKPIAAGAAVKGNPTIGVGRNLAGKGLSEGEIAYLLKNDIQEVQAFLRGYVWFPKLTPARQAALTDMAFNLGRQGFANFKQMIAALARGDYEAAASAMLDSKAAQELKTRYQTLADMMRTSRWPAKIP